MVHIRLNIIKTNITNKGQTREPKSPRKEIQLKQQNKLKQEI